MLHFVIIDIAVTIIMDLFINVKYFRIFLWCYKVFLRQARSNIKMLLLILILTYNVKN